MRASLHHRSLNYTDVIRVFTAASGACASAVVFSPPSAIAAGGEYLGMEHFVVSGPRSGIPHATWRRRTIQPGDITVLETAACIDRYHAALFHTVTTGPVADRILDTYALCREALEAVLACMRPGVTCAEVHQVAQDVIDRAGHTGGYRNRTGYSIRIAFASDLGEGNILSLYRGVEVPLEPGIVFHVSITLRDYARFTVAVSETVVVTDSGWAASSGRRNTCVRGSQQLVKSLGRRSPP